MSIARITCGLVVFAAISGVSASNVQAGDFRITVGVRTNSADDLNWLRRHESYADRYNRYSGFRYSYPRYGYGSSYYSSRYYGSSYYRYSPYRYYYRPSYTLPSDRYRSGYYPNSSSRIFIGSPYAFSYSLDGYYFGRSRLGLGYGYGSRLRPDRRLVPPSDCCARPYYCYYMGIVPATPHQPFPSAPLSTPTPVAPTVPVIPHTAPMPNPAPIPIESEAPQPNSSSPAPQPAPRQTEPPVLTLPPITAPSTTGPSV